MFNSTFTLWDYAVLAAVLLISAIIGLYYRYSGGRQRTTKEYLMADRSMSAGPVAFSLMASFMSAVTLLGVSNESYQFGTMFCIINLSYVMATPIAAYVFLPVFYNMKVTSVYEYLERRFGHATRLCASLAYSVQMVLYMGIVLFAPALALEAVTGINRFTAIVVIGSVCTFYSTIGGMKAVLITDVFQSVLMFAAIYSVIAISAVKGGGFAAIWQTARDRGRLNWVELSIDPTVRHTWWSLTIGGMVTYLSIYGVNQVQVQRLLSVRNLRAAQSALWLSLPILNLLSFSTLFSGLAIFYYYRDCDPLAEGRITSSDQMMPLFAIDTMGQYPGLSGLFVSGILSASLSSISSAVSSLAAVTLEDYFKPLYKKLLKQPMPDLHTTLLSKLLAFVYGIVCIALAFGAGSLGGILQASLTIFGVIGGPLLAIFTLGMATTRSNQRGVLTGLLLGLVFSLVIGFGGPKPPPPSLPVSTSGCLGFNATTTTTTTTTMMMMTTTSKPPTEYFWLYRLSYWWLSVLGFLLTAISGYCCSRLLERLGCADNSRIYVNGIGKHLDFNLFMPQLARKLKKQAAVEITRFGALPLPGRSPLRP